MEDNLKQSIRQIVNDFGPDIINNKNLVNIVADYYSFDRNPAVRNILKAIVSGGYTVKISQLKTSKGDPCIDLERYAGEIEQSWGFSKDRVRFVLSCFASCLGINYEVENFSSQNQRLILPSNAKIVADNLTSQQSQQKSKGGLVNNYVEEVRELAEKGDAKEQYSLGNLYYTGLFVTKDYKEAITWFRKAAEQGFPKAEYKLGFMYYFGKGTDKNLEEAYTWIMKAVEHGASDSYDLVIRLKSQTQNNE